MRFSPRRPQRPAGSTKPLRARQSLVAVLAAVLAATGSLAGLALATAPLSSAAAGPPVISTIAGGPQPSVPVANNVALAPADVVFQSVSGQEYVDVADDRDDVV